MDSEVSETPVNGDGHKDILAPADESPRENLINTAIKFLQHPKVSTSPLYQKKAFLEKKGLTAAEIDLAIQRSGIVEPQENSQLVPAPRPSQALINQNQPQYIVPVPPQSVWARARDLTFTTVIVAGVSYGIYQLFQKYLRPLIMGKSEHERRLDRLESQIADIHKSVADSLAELNLTLANIKATLNTQQSSSVAETRGVADLRSDIASLKGLLLSRNQFPPAPSTAPVLPSWQRASASTSSQPSRVTNAPSEPAAVSGLVDEADLEASGQSLVEETKSDGDVSLKTSGDESNDQETNPSALSNAQADNDDSSAPEVSS